MEMLTPRIERDNKGKLLSARSAEYYDTKWSRIEREIAEDDRLIEYYREHGRPAFKVHCLRCMRPQAEGRAWHARQDELQRRGFASLRTAA